MVRTPFRQSGQNLGLIVGGVYRRNRSSQPDLERDEMVQLTNQILKAAQTGKAVLLLGDLNLDHSNPDHKKKNEANDLLCAIEAATMRHLPTGITWKSDGYHKVCKCDTQIDHIWLEKLVSRVKARDFKASNLAKVS